MGSCTQLSWKLFMCAATLLLLANQVKAEDFYERLGISRQANQREIRKAFKKLALIHHPDKNLVNIYIFLISKQSYMSVTKLQYNLRVFVLDISVFEEGDIAQLVVLWTRVLGNGSWKILNSSPSQVT